MATRHEDPSDSRSGQGQQGSAGQQSQQAQSASAATGSTGAGAERGDRRPGARSGGGSATDAGGATGRSAEAERPIPMSGEGARGQRMQPTRGRGAMVRQAPTGLPGLFRGGFTASPLELVQRMSDEMNELLESVVSLGQPGYGLAGRARSGQQPLAPMTSEAWVPQVDVIRRQDAVVVRADLPGIPPDDIVVTVEDGMLTIAGDRREERREEDEGVVRNELTYGSFFRAIPLPDGVDENRVAANFQNGVLEIVIPIAERERGRRVRIGQGQVQGQAQSQGQGQMQGQGQTQGQGQMHGQR